MLEIESPRLLGNFLRFFIFFIFYLFFTRDIPRAFDLCKRDVTIKFFTRIYKRLSHSASDAED